MSDNFVLSPDLLRALLDHVPTMAESTVDAVSDAVPQYRRFFASRRGGDVRQQIEIALRTFVRLAALPAGSTDDEAMLAPALDAASAMGRSEARAGRDTAVVLNAFRVGGRSTWAGVSEMSSTAGLSGPDVADLAGRLFDYVDRISAATVAGHQEELSGLRRTRDVERDALVRAVVSHGHASPEQCARADWPLPPRVVLVLTSADDVEKVLRPLPSQAIVAIGELPGPTVSAGLAVVLVPETRPSDRAAVLAAVREPAVVGPSTPIDQAHLAFRWATRLWPLTATDASALDADTHLSQVLTRSEPELIALMRHQLLSPLDDLPEGTRLDLEATLASWLRHHGRQDRVAADLFIHPQTVRYRLRRLEELLGDVVHDPTSTLSLLMCLQAS